MELLDRIIEKQATTLYINHNKTLWQLYCRTVLDIREKSKVLNIRDQIFDEDFLYCNLEWIVTWKENIAT